MLLGWPKSIYYTFCFGCLVVKYTVIAVFDLIILPSQALVSMFMSSLNMGQET